MQPVKHIGFLIKPASSACMMRCKYCFYCDVAQHRQEMRYPVMAPQVFHTLIDKALALAPDAEISFAFQGGEPTLAGLDFFKEFIAYVDAHRQQQRISYALQTNGFLIDDTWAAFLAQHHFLVGVSVDGWRDVHDYLRPDAQGAGTYDRVMAHVKLLRAAHVEVNILTVLTAQLARHPQQAWHELIRSGTTYVQYVPCLPGLDEKSNQYSLSPHDFSYFYRVLFDQWYQSFMHGSYKSIWLFENIMQMALGQYPSQCGMLGACAPQFVTEANGDVYPCDFYAFDRYLCGNIQDKSLEELATSEVTRAFLAEPRRPCAACADCPFEGMCHRNCKRLNIAYYDAHYCGLREFLSYAYDGLYQVAHILAAHP